MQKEKFSAKKNDFTEGYSTYDSVVYSTGYTNVDNEDDTNDICQEVFGAFPKTGRDG